MTERLSDLDPFTVHDPGCHCWPHVSESALSEAAIAGAVAEYRESMHTLTRLRAIEEAARADLDARDAVGGWPDYAGWAVIGATTAALRAALGSER